MTRAWVSIILGLAAVSTLSGCGTMLGNMGGLGPRRYEIYGGVKTDFDAEADCFNSLIKPTTSEWRGSAILPGAFLLIDLPLSAVADTLTLPWTIKATLDGEAGPTALGLGLQPIRNQQETDQSSGNTSRP